MGKTIKAPNGREVDLGIYSDLSKADMKKIQLMLNATSPQPRKRAVRKQNKDKGER